MDELPIVECPEMPKWLKAADTAMRENKPKKVSETLLELLALYRSASDRNPNSANQLALRIEAGDVPRSNGLEEAIKWHAWAAHLGHAGSKFRLVKLLFFINENAEMIDQAKMHAKEFLAHIVMSKRLSTTEIQRAATVMDLVLENEPDEEYFALVEDVLMADNFDKHPDFNSLQLKIQGNANTSGGKQPLCLQVIKQKIPEDSDFKPGIYKKLERNLPLVRLPNPELVKSALEKEFPWFSNINAIVYQQLLIQQYNVKPAFKLRPLLIAGDSGLGKTTWARRVAKLCSVPFRTIMAGGSSDSMLLKGLARGWSSARPSLVLQTIATESITNPVFLLDEIDKASPDAKNGRIWDTLLGLLEPSNSKNFFDECLTTTCDLSWVSWLATANAIGHLPKPLLERFQIVVVTAPGPEHSMTLIYGARKAFASELGIDPRMLPDLSHADIEVIRQSTSPRKINQMTRYFIEKNLVNESQNALRN